MKIAHRMTIVLDEAHKCLTNSDADRFNQSICNIIRQQRHLAVAARVIISTQEPTVVPLLDLHLPSIFVFLVPSPSYISTHTETAIGAQPWDDAFIDQSRGGRDGDDLAHGGLGHGVMLEGGGSVISDTSCPRCMYALSLPTVSRFNASTFQRFNFRCPTRVEKNLDWR